MKRFFKEKFIFVLSAMVMCCFIQGIVTAQEGEDVVRNIAYTVNVDVSVQGTLTDENGNLYTQDEDGNRIYTDIAFAKDYVRLLDKTSGDIVVKIAGGFYYHPETITFTNEDSGNENCTIYYEAADKNDLPIISGGYILSSAWTEAAEVSGVVDGTVYKTTLNRDKKLRAIYVNGNRASMTKRVVSGTVASDEQYTITPDKSNSDWAWVSGSKSVGTIFENGTIPADARNPQNIELETQTTFNKAIVCVDKLETTADNKVLARLQQPYGVMAQSVGWAPYKPAEPNTVHNVFEWLSKPGEFYFDQASSTLYYVAGKGEDMNSAQVVIPELDTIVELKGTHTLGDSAKYAHVQNITFDGLAFKNSDWNLWDIAGSHGNAGVQAATGFVKMASESWHNDMYRSYDIPPAAFKADIAKNINILNGQVQNTGCLGIHLENDIKNFEIKGNSIKNTGGSGIVIGHPQHVFENDPDNYKSKGVGADKEKFARGTEAAPVDIFINNNYLRDTCNFFHGQAPITSFYTKNMQILNNFIYGSPYTGISFGWGWNNFDGDPGCNLPNIPSTTSTNNKISGNRIESVIKVLRDAGAIYSLGRQGNDDWTDYTEMQHNYLNLTRGSTSGISGGRNGFHTDEGSAYIKIKENVITNFTGSVFELNEWKRKHDILADRNYSNTTHMLLGAPKCEVTNHYITSDSVWDKTGYEVVLNSGLEDEYKYMIDGDLTNDLISTLPASVCVPPGSTIPIGGLLSSDSVVWLAPKGTSEFVQGNDMTCAPGNSKTIDVPKNDGEYRLYIKYANGTVSNSSEYLVLAGSKIANVNDGDQKVVSKLKPLELKLKDDIYTYTLNDKTITSGCQISTSGTWVLAATEKSTGGVTLILFTTSVSDADMLLQYDLNVSPGDRVHLSYNLLDASKTVWIAPYATFGGFVESDRMIKIPGDQNVITVPPATDVEIYNIYVVDKNGGISSSLASLSTLPVSLPPASGLDLWLKADAGITKDDAGNVGEWTNQAGNGEKFTSPSKEGSPSIVQDTNGYSYLNFNGKNSLVNNAFKSYNGKSNLTMIVMGESTSDNMSSNGDQYSALFFPETSSWGGMYFSLYNDSVKFRYGIGSSKGILNYTRTETPSGLECYTALKDGPEQSLYINDKKVKTDTGLPSEILGIDSKVYIGNTNKSYGFTGKISEVMIYDRTVTDDEISAINKYMRSKYSEDVAGVASKIVSLDHLKLGDTAVTLPKVPIGYAVEVKSAEPSIVDINGNFTQPYEGQDLKIKLTVYKCGGNASADTITLTTGLPPSPPEPEYIDKTWTVPATSVQDFFNTLNSKNLPKIESGGNIGYVYNTWYPEHGGKAGEVGFKYPNCSLDQLKSLTIEVDTRAKAANGAGHVSIRLDSRDGVEIANAVLKVSRYEEQDLGTIQIPDGVTGEHDLYAVFYTENNAVDKWVANVKQLKGTYVYKNPNYKRISIPSFTVESGVTVAKINVNDDCSGTLLAAIYDSSDVCIETKVLSPEELVNVTFTSECSYMKVFYWENIDNLVPKCEAVTKTVE